MARASFTLRKTTSDFGSYASYPPSSDGTASSVGLPIRTDDDSFLRADDLQIAVPLVEVIPGGNEWSTVGFFTVEAVDYRAVSVSWGLPLATTLTTTPQATRVVLAYSPYGEPATIPEGSTLVDSADSSGTLIHDVDPGAWAYYTLFVKYESTAGDEYFEPAASLSVLTPSDLGSTNALYSKIPTYYREQDEALDAGAGGPLYRYLSVIGWDVDRLRTLIDFLMSSKDPQQANSQTLDLIASDLGLDLLSQELGAVRLRALINDIGTLRRSNGLPTALTAALTALTGSVVTLDGSTIRVQPQRVNYVWDPMVTSVGNNADGGTPFSSYVENIDGGVVTTTTWDPTGPYGSPVDGGAPNTAFADTGIWGMVPDPLSVNSYIARTLSASVPIAADDVFYFSIHNQGQEVITSVTLERIIGGNRLAVDTATTPQLVGSRKYWRLVIPSEEPFGLAAIKITYALPQGSDPTLQNVLPGMMLLEKNFIGNYFDGNTVRGGWVAGSPSISDFRWLGTENDSFSVYSENYQKTASVVRRLLPSLLPVTRLVTSGTVYSNRPVDVTSYTITYNYIPGFS